MENRICCLIYNYLKSIGLEDECIICLALDDDENIKYRNPLELGKYIRSLAVDESKTYYVFLDEIQKYEEFYHVYDGDKRDAWQEYYTYGGLPLVMKKKGHEEKARYPKYLKAKDK